MLKAVAVWLCVVTAWFDFSRLSLTRLILYVMFMLGTPMELIEGFSVQWFVTGFLHAVLRSRPDF